MISSQSRSPAAKQRLASEQPAVDGEERVAFQDDIASLLGGQATKTVGMTDASAPCTATAGRRGSADGDPSPRPGWRHARSDVLHHVQAVRDNFQYVRPNCSPARPAGFSFTYAWMVQRQHVMSALLR